MDKEICIFNINYHFSVNITGVQVDSNNTTFLLHFGHYVHMIHSSRLEGISFTTTTKKICIFQFFICTSSNP